MEVLITGGTGFIGRHLCGELVDRGHQVIAMSRDPDASSVPDEVELRSGDVTTYDGLTDVLERTDAVVHLVSLSPLYQPRGGNDLHEQVHVQGTRNLVRAMEAVETDRLIHVSGVGADPDGPTAFIRAKGRAEGIVESADLDVTIFRPTAIFGDGGEFISFVKLLTTPYLTGLPGGGTMDFQPIWVNDIVTIFADALEDDRHIGETYEIGGPEVLSLADITRITYRSEGRGVRIVPVPMPLAALALTLAGPIPWIPFGRDQYRSLSIDNAVSHNSIDVFGRDETDLVRIQDYLHGDAPQR